MKESRKHQAAEILTTAAAAIVLPAAVAVGCGVVLRFAFLYASGSQTPSHPYRHRSRDAAAADRMLFDHQSTSAPV